MPTVPHPLKRRREPRTQALRPPRPGRWGASDRMLRHATTRHLRDLVRLGKTEDEDLPLHTHE